MIESVTERNRFARGLATTVRVRGLDVAKMATLLILVGSALRIACFAANRSLWLDEAMLALNIVERPFADLLRPLDYNQAAPIGFLMLLKAATSVWGDHEYALRLVPLIAGLACLPLFWQLAKQVLSPGEALIALCIFAIGDTLVYYSAEVKQYSLDVALTLGILLCALPVLREERPGRRRYLYLALLGAAAVWFSIPAVLVLAGVGAALFLSAKDGRQRAAVLAVAAVWFASFLLDYFLFLRVIRDNDTLRGSWDDRFLAWPTSPAAVRRDIEMLLLPFATLLGLTQPLLAKLGFVGGLNVLYRRDRRILGLLVAPFAPALLASLLHVYPFTSRPILFTVPLFLLLIGAGVGAVREAVSRHVPLFGAALLLALLWGPAAGAARSFLRPPAREETRNVLQYLSGRMRPGDAVWVSHPTQHTFRYYVEFGGQDRIAALDPVISKRTKAEKDRILTELQPVLGKPRVWFVFSYTDVQGNRDELHERELILGMLDRMGKRLDQVEATNAWGYLYDLTAPPPQASPPTPR